MGRLFLKIKYLGAQRQLIKCTGHDIKIWVEEALTAEVDKKST